MKDYSALINDEIESQVFDYQQGKPSGTNWGKLRKDFHPCTNPADAWSIIMENRISLIPEPYSGWTAVSGLELYPTSEYLDERFHDKIIAGDYNPLRAAMIVFLMMVDAKT